MNNLTVTRHNGINVVDSREVAEMVDKRHDNLLRDIDGYSKILTNSDLRTSDFFHLNSYQDSKGEWRPRYLLTRKGCDMVANKMTGEKGVLFTAAYVTKFEEMEKSLAQPLSQVEALLKSVQLLADQERQMKEIKEAQSQISATVIDHTFALSSLEQKVTNEITLTTREQAQIQGAVSARIKSLHDRTLYPKLYSGLKKQFGVPSYRDLKRSDLSRAFSFINYWTPTMAYSKVF